jgi:hypothetical protein
VTIQKPSQQLNSTSKPYSGDSLNKEEANILSPDLHLSNTDFKSLTKKELIEAGGGQLTEQTLTTKKKLLSPHFDLEAKEETPQTPTSSSHLANSNNTQLLHWLNSFPHTLPDPKSPPSADFLRLLLECHKLHQLPLSLQQAYWAELLELEYPLEEPSPQTRSEKLLEEEEDWVEDLLEIREEQDPQKDLQCYVSMARVARLEQVLDCGYFGGSVPESGVSWYRADE